MKLKFSILAALTGALLFGAPAAHAQPATKLTTNLSPATINAIWCSALFLQQSNYGDEDSEDLIYFEDMAFDIGAQLDDVMDEAGLPYVESEEIWTIFDNAAAEYWLSDADGFFDTLSQCEAAHADNKLKLR